MPSDRLKTLVQEERELLRLEFDRADCDNGDVYRITEVGISVGDFLKAVNDLDPRDVPFDYEYENGRRVRFAHVLSWYVPAINRLVVRAHGCYPSLPDGWMSRLKRSFGRATGAVPVERAPWSWTRLNKRHVRRQLRSGDRDEIAHGLNAFRTSHLSSRDMRWGVEVLREWAKSGEPRLAALAIEGLGELARVHGWHDREVAMELREMGLGRHPVTLSVALSRTCEVMERFGEAHRPG